ncbi:MAG TPA: phospho-sugar mutase [Sphingobacteriaceae bacterium]|nr:phospho-sugar mutase [Sphingobacteriaceae bacterium]
METMDAGKALERLDLPPSLKERIREWLAQPFDRETIAEVENMILEEQLTELTDAFYKDLEFGTGGLRGILGVGTNRMNTYTVGRATQGLSNYLLKTYPNEQIKVAIAFDSRNQSVEFSELIASVFAGNGFTVYRFEELRPTPQLSFAIRHLGCHSGVMITASHNPKEYNGYKAYWKDGGQLVAPHDRGVIAEVQAISDPAMVKTFSGSAAHAAGGEILGLGSELDEAYFKAVLKQAIRPEVVRQEKDLRMVYSSIHGTGITLVPELLKRWGFEEVYVVDSQARPDGTFPTVVYPNPEEAEAMTLALEEARKVDAELVMATDPDADRVGLAIRTATGGYTLLNGNQIGSLLVDYVLSSMSEKHLLRPDDYVVTTIVTTRLISDIAASYGVSCWEVLTGFKYIGELMTAQEGQARFVVGGEESYGYLIGDLVRDKDAVISCAFIAEMAAWHKSQGRSLQDALLGLYLRHGFYKERLVSLTKKGKSGADEIEAMMAKLRSGPVYDLGDVAVARINDFLSGESRELANDRVSEIDLPRSNVLQFETVEGDVLSIRPSGTEPKIKFYCSVKGRLEEAADFDEWSRQLDEKIDSMMKAVLEQ